MPRFDTLMESIETARRTRVALAAAESTIALHRFAQVFLPAYEQSKLDQGVLDFDDLIRRTQRMLSGPVISWVLYRLDGRIDHILVDEAQDTSPEQWKIIQSLAAAIHDDPERNRTLFVVGDRKQSIYSFQGADADGFEEKRKEIDLQLSGGLRGKKLLHSFRSSPAILNLVDCVAADLGGLGDSVMHSAFRPEMPGRVDLLPLIPAAEEAEETAWYDPVDRTTNSAPAVKLGCEIASLIEAILEDETLPERDGSRRSVNAGDIMVLVQRRSAVFDQIIAACKAKNLPIAGSDRLKIGAELAVKDLLALMSFLNLPEDDLSLAATLRSPIFGWSEQELFSLAAKRGDGRTLWSELETRQTDFAETHRTLRKLRDLVDYARPYELLEQILGRFGARKKLLSRLGAEAADGIDELLSQAIEFEHSNVPSMTAFLKAVTSDDIEIKRSADTGDQLIRVMTVHGAKGLERPIVILPDTTGRGRASSGKVVVTEGGMPILNVSNEHSPDTLLVAKEAQKLADAEERNRLLYVAMTRAEN